MPPTRSRRRPLAILLRAARYFAVIYLSILLCMTFLERRLVYPAPPAERAAWTPPGDEHQDVWLTATDGVRTHGRYYPRAGASRAILYCHGNGECVSDNHHLMRILRDELDASVLIFDYRGYGLSEGRPIERGVIADGHAALAWLCEATDREPDQVILVGRSLGGGVAVALAAEQGAAALVLQSTFTRLTDAAAAHYPILPVRWLMRNRFDSIDRIARFPGPVVISHGTSDRVVPVAHAQRMYEAVPGPHKLLIDHQGLGHNDPQPITYYTRVREFLSEIGA